MNDYNIMDVVIVLELALTLFAVWAIMHPQKYDELNRRLRRWERRTWHKMTHKIRLVLRPIVNGKGGIV